MQKCKIVHNLIEKLLLQQSSFFKSDCGLPVHIVCRRQSIHFIILALFEIHNEMQL